MRRPLALTAVAAVVAASLTGCVFVPGLVQGDDPTASPVFDPIDETDDTTQPDDTTEPDDTEQPDADDDADITDDPDDFDDPYALDEWPDEVPKPEGKELPSEDPGMMMVEGDQAAYDAYLQQLEDAGFTEDGNISDEGMSWWTDGEHRVLVMLFANILSVSVTEEYY